MIQEDRCYIVAEIGLNHNGSYDKALELIKGARWAGADAVKFQKRTVDKVYTQKELATKRDSPYGTTYGELKYGLEFGKEEYDRINSVCKELKIDWYASPWDEDSADFLCKYDIPYLKIASGCITNKELLNCCAYKRPLLLSTGMSDATIIDKAIKEVRWHNGKIACLYHCISTYPTSPKDINLKAITTLQYKYSGTPIGYSGHEIGMATTVAAVVLGAVSVERHITLSKSDWGNDQAASLDIQGFQKLCRDIRLIEEAMGDGKLEIAEDEYAEIPRLRKKTTL